MNSEYMRTNKTVLVVNSFGNVYERINRNNIKDILIRENRLEELEQIIKRCEKNIKIISNKQQKNKNNLVILIFLSFIATLIVGYFSFLGLSSTIIGIKIASILTSGIFSLVGIKVTLKTFRSINNLDNIYNADIIGYKSKIDVATKKKSLVELELQELEKNKKVENVCDSYYVQLNDDKYLTKLYNKLENSYKVNKDKYLEDRNKPKVLKKVKKR